MIEQIVTSFSLAGAQHYGLRCVQSLVAHCVVPTVAYVDAPMRLPVDTRLTADLSDWTTTARRLPNERPSATRPAYYRWHARRFAIKPFVWFDAAERLGRGLLTWLDGDTLAMRDVPHGFWAELLGDADVAYLGRRSMHPETGYVGFRIPEALPLLRWCREVYVTRAILDFDDGWTDCHVLRAGLAAVGTRSRDLTSHLYAGKSHIWPVSPLGRYFKHFKGGKTRLPGVAA